VTHRHLSVDRSTIDLRDALAHGRVSAANPRGPLFLLKFDHRYVGSTTRVSYAQDISLQWLSDQVKRVRNEIEKVTRAPGSPIVTET
jgi:hypothetical protein